MDHEKRNALRKLSLTLRSANNDVNLDKSTFVTSVGCPEETSPNNSKITTLSNRSSRFKSHFENTFPTPPRRPMRQKQLAELESSKIEQETKGLKSLCDKENKEPSEINEHRQHKEAIRPLMLKVQNSEPHRKIQDCNAKELQLKRNARRRAEKSSKNNNDSQTISKNQQNMELNDDIGQEVAELTKGTIPPCDKRYPVINLNKLELYNNKTTSKAHKFLPQSNSALRMQDPKSSFVQRSEHQNRTRQISAPKAQISKQSAKSNRCTPLQSVTKLNKNTYFSDDEIDTSKRRQTHCDYDRHSSLAFINKESVMTSTEEPTISSANKGVGTASISEFHPQRNSTMQFEREQPVSIAISNANHLKKVAGTQNNHDQEVSYSTCHSTKIGNKTNKFFHRQDANTANSMCKSVTTMLSCKKNNNSRLPPKRSTQVRREQVYDFLSQSQMSDSDGNEARGKKNKPADAAADIIQKLIAEGRVCVATCVKGRSVLKRTHIKRPKKVKLNRKVAKKKNTKAQDIQKPLNKPQRIVGPIVEQNDDHHAAGEDLDIGDDFLGNDLNIQKHTAVTRNYKDNNFNPEQEGTFSNLARSVLLNQAGRSDPQWLNAKRLLDTAKKLISTPKNKNIPPIRTTINADFSPILSLAPQQRLAANASPWRVDVDAHLPRVFNFSRSSGNLPSFSSDFIPSTPRKGNPHRSNTAKLTEAEVNQCQDSPIPEIEGITSIPKRFSTALDHNSVNSSIPSFSSNDSNIENQCPEKQWRANDDSADIFNLKQLPNPRRALTYRSPLKAINVVQVVALPSLDMSKIIADNKKPRNSSSKKLKSPHKSEENLFGFEEFLSQTDTSTQPEESQISDFITTSPVKMINEKRHLLRKLKPVNADVHISLQNREIGEKLSNKNAQLFNDSNIVSGKQRTVKEMLCSTMLVETAKTNSKAQEVPRNIGHYRDEEINNSSGMLFKDIDPETTFNEEDPHRTYVRPYTRKRRLNENRVIYALESDDSDADANDSTDNKKPHKNQIHQTDIISEKLPETRRKKKQRKEKPELIHFVESFNEMCKEVENYELVVEKSV